MLRERQAHADAEKPGVSEVGSAERKLFDHVCPSASARASCDMAPTAVAVPSVPRKALRLTFI